MTLAEAARLAKIMAADPASAIAAAGQGWEYPVDRETLVLLDLYDLERKKVDRRAKPHPMRPSRPTSTTRRGNVAGRSPDEVRRILRENAGR